MMRNWTQRGGYPAGDVKVEDMPAPPQKPTHQDVERVAKALYSVYRGELEDFYGPSVGWDAEREHVRTRFREDVETFEFYLRHFATEGADDARQ